MSQFQDNARVLVIDDDPVVLGLVSRQLSNNGMEPLTAADGPSGLALARERTPDLILLDVILPGDDGFSVCAELKQDPATAPIPVIFLTGRGDEQEVLHGFDVGGVDYIIKPFDPRILLARVNTHTRLARLSRHLQAELDERTAHLAQAHKRMRQLNVEMALTEERERRRLAEQLHGTAVQQLVLTGILVDDQQREHAEPPERLERIAELVDQTLEQLRTLIFDLSPPLLYEAGLFPAIDWLSERMTRQWDIVYTCELQGAPVELPNELLVTLYQAANELLVNVAKHAQATRAHTLIRYDAEQILLAVEDDGIGFAESGKRKQRVAVSSGFGLFSLESRVELLGGHLDIDPIDSGGTLVSLSLPIRPPGTAAP